MPQGGTSIGGPLTVAGVDILASIAGGNGMANVRGGHIGGKTLYVGVQTLQTAQDLIQQGLQVYPTLFGANGALAALSNRSGCGDVIYVLEGHTENVAAADAASDTGTAAYFSVIGLGSGTNRPSFTWTAAASTWLLDTAGVELANLQLNLCSTAATVVVTPITVSAANCRIVNCFINWGLSTTIGVGSTLGAIAVTTAGDYFDFIGNFCVNLDVAGTTGQAITLLSLNGADYCRIIANRIFGATTATTVGPVHFLTTLSKNVQIYWNYIENLIASSTIAISSAIPGVTGSVAFNQLRVNSGITAITASANMSTTGFQNYTSDTVNLNGALDVLGGTAT